MLWSERQAELLRRLADGEQVNWENVAEELDSVARSQRLALASHLRVVLEHLTKLEASPSFEPRRGWSETVRRARADIKDLLDDSPSLRRAVGTIMARQIQDVREAVAETLADYGETPRVALEGLSHDAEAVLGGFFPAEPTASA